MSLRKKFAGSWGLLGMRYKKLSDICGFVKGKIDIASLTQDTYISTENMLANKAGIVAAAMLPIAAQTQRYEKGDVLISNIRPYFKKIWHSIHDGGCSNDVLVFRAKENVSSEFLYYVLSDDKFFDYATATSKGTKMPRGDKRAIMEYDVPDFSLEDQQRIASILKSLDDKIALNRTINKNLA